MMLWLLVHKLKTFLTWCIHVRNTNLYILQAFEDFGGFSGGHKIRDQGHHSSSDYIEAYEDDEDETGGEGKFGGLPGGQKHEPEPEYALPKHHFQGFSVRIN